MHTTTAHPQNQKPTLDKTAINALRQHGDIRTVYDRLTAQGIKVHLKTIEYYLRNESATSAYETEILREFTTLFKERAERIKQRQATKDEALAWLGLISAPAQSI